MEPRLSHHQFLSDLHGQAMRTSITGRHRHARHQTIARYETRGSTGPPTKSLDEAEVEVEAEDTRVTTHTMTASPGMTGEAVVEEEVDEVDTAAAMVVVVAVGTRATDSRTTQTTTVEM